MIPPPGTAVLVFDVDQTLIDTGAAWEHALAITCARAADAAPGLSAGDLGSAYRAVSGDLWPRYDDVLAPLATVIAIREHAWGQALAACGAALPASQVRLLATAFGAAQLAAIRPDLRLPRLMARARERYRVAACSNGEGSLTRAKLRAAGLLRFMEVVTCGMDEGVRKPDPELLRRCCQHLAADPGTCLHIGDDWGNDIIAASRAGLHPVWICRASPDDQSTPPPAVARYPAVAGFLDALLPAARR
jgi:putative hydrolase of the HAD superfamily